MLYFFDEETCKKTYKEMEQMLINKSLEEVWKIACTYAENYVHTQQQNAFMTSLNKIDVNEIMNMAAKIVAEQQGNKNV